MEGPSWMQSAGTGESSATVSSGRAESSRAAPADNGNAVVIRTIFHFVNIGVSVMMAASAAFGLIAHRNIHNILLSFYLMIFAVLLFSYEMVRVMVRSGPLHRMMQENFGFFFGAKGRGLYLIFVGFLNFPLGSLLSQWTAIVTLGWGIITVFTYMSRPEWFESPKPTQPTVS